MNIVLIITSLFFLCSCNASDPRFVRKELDNKDITVTWYYYSYISNQSPDYVVVEKSGVKREIFKATWLIVDVNLKDNKIVIRLLKPHDSHVFPKTVEKEVFGYQIVFDSTATYDEMQLIPDGKKTKTRS